MASQMVAEPDPLLKVGAGARSFALKNAKKENSLDPQ